MNRSCPRAKLNHLYCLLWAWKSLGFLFQIRKREGTGIQWEETWSAPISFSTFLHKFGIKRTMKTKSNICLFLLNKDVKCHRTCVKKLHSFISVIFLWSLVWISSELMPQRFSRWGLDSDRITPEHVFYSV